MASNPQIAALPAVRKLAEEWADDLIQALPIIQDGPITSDFARVIVEQLSDLTRPASQDAVARLVAAKVPNVQAWEIAAGCECGGGRLNMVLRCCGLPEASRWEPDPAPDVALLTIALHVLGSAHD